VVTDSTAGLPPGVAEEHGLTVVPLSITIDGVTGREGIDVSPGDVAKALVARRVSVTTSRPSPGEFAEVYERLLGGGAAGIVSVHLSARLSGTCEAARAAAAGHPDRVAVVDSLSTGLGLGFCALAAAAPADLAAAARAARDAAERTTTLFYVDTLEYLRKGGRIGAASALLGTALSVKPILHMVGGEIVVRDKVRTASRALTRLEDLAVAAAGDGPVEVGVHHLAAPERAEALAARLRERLDGRLHTCYETEIGAAVGAHVGPGLVSVVVHNRSTD
jgi:fatty acid kinase fatty acid binding subunit